MQSFIFFLLALVAGSHGYSYIIPASLTTPGICFYNGHILPKGDSQLPMICQNTNCHEDGSVTVEGCGRIPLPNCTLIEEGSLMKSYPECCEMTYQCIDEDGNSYKKQWNQLNPINSNAGTVSTDKKVQHPLILKLLQFF